MATPSYVRCHLGIHLPSLGGLPSLPALLSLPSEVCLPAYAPSAPWQCIYMHAYMHVGPVDGPHPRANGGPSLRRTAPRSHCSAESAWRRACTLLLRPGQCNGMLHAEMGRDGYITRRSSGPRHAILISFISIFLLALVSTSRLQIYYPSIPHVDQSASRDTPRPNPLVVVAWLHTPPSSGTTPVWSSRPCATN